MNETEEWFETWFDSPYYHALYCNRNPNEAREFLEAFDLKIGIPRHSTVLDLACGSGRHSRILHEMGLKVYGLDLSANNIARAKDESDAAISFSVGDMRNFNLNTRFDIIFNLFTSFGYFEDFDKNLQVLQNCHRQLTPNGRLIIDYFNADFVRNNFSRQEKFDKKGLSFNINRSVENNLIIKEIEVSDKGVSHFYTEKVLLIDLQQFQSMAGASGFRICETFGSYQLQPFNPMESERLILLLEKSTQI